MEDLVLDYGPEWWASTEEERLRRSRVGAPLTSMLHDYGVVSYIDASDAADPRAWKLAALQAKVRVHGSRRLVKLLRELWRRCRRLSWPEVACETAALAARKMAKSFPNAGADTLAVTGLLYASAVHGLTLDIDSGERHRLYRLIRRAGLPHARRETETVAHLVAMLAAELGLPPLAEQLAMRIYRAYHVGLQGSNPRSIAAAVLYVAAKLLDKPIPQKDLAKAAGTTEASLRHAMKKAGITIIYKLKAGFEAEEKWWPGKDSYGVRRPSEIAAWYSVKNYSVKITIGSPIIVEIEVVENER